MQASMFSISSRVWIRTVTGVRGIEPKSYTLPMRIRLLALLALIVAFITAACAHTTPPQTRAFIMGGHRAGTETVITSGDTRTIDFEFNDRGRGPKTHTVMTTDAHSVTASLKTDGNDYFKVPVAEMFANGAW